MFCLTCPAHCFCCCSWCWIWAGGLKLASLVVARASTGGEARYVNSESLQLVLCIHETYLAAWLLPVEYACTMPGQAKHRCIKQATSVCCWLTSAAQISRDDLDTAVAAVGEFGWDNRAGVEGTLHRISAIRSRRGDIVGLTCRVGRAVTGQADMLRDVLNLGQSILILGK